MTAKEKIEKLERQREKMEGKKEEFAQSPRGLPAQQSNDRVLVP